MAKVKNGKNGYFWTSGGTKNRDRSAVFANLNSLVIFHTGIENDIVKSHENKVKITIKIIKINHIKTPLK